MADIQEKIKNGTDFKIADDTLTIINSISLKEKVEEKEETKTSIEPDVKVNGESTIVKENSAPEVEEKNVAVTPELPVSSNEKQTIPVPPVMEQAIPVTPVVEQTVSVPPVMEQAISIPPVIDQVIPNSAVNFNNSESPIQTFNSQSSFPLNLDSTFSSNNIETGFSSDNRNTLNSQFTNFDNNFSNDAITFSSNSNNSFDFDNIISSINSQVPDDNSVINNLNNFDGGISTRDILKKAIHKALDDYDIEEKNVNQAFKNLVDLDLKYMQEYGFPVKYSKAFKKIMDDYVNGVPIKENDVPSLNSEEPSADQNNYLDDPLGIKSGYRSRF